MTIDPSAPPPGRRWGVVLAVALVAGAIGWLAFSGIGNALVYYRTPTELTALGEQGIGPVIRLGGLVLPNSLACADGGVDFILTDGQTQVPVHGAPGNGLLCPREGVGVVVEGRLNAHGVFEPTQVIVKHDENYVAPSAGGLPSQVIDPGT
ncbi:MAG TPA: cytochrome c maturation protein CcmE [Candidatus Limnocylindrales bacterium]|nr:cytochrome c maturation protein CcmE [Candidatus Limnocylindrales bacterium]